MSSNDAPALAFTRGIATVGLGLTAGFMGNVSYSSIKMLFEHLWSLTYDYGASVMVPSIPILTTLLATSSYLAAKPVAYMPRNWIAMHRRGLLAFAALLTFANFPYTYFFIVPTIKKLKGIEARMVKDGAEGKASEASDTDYDIQRWRTLHHWRTAGGLIAFTIAVAELVAA